MNRDHGDRHTASGLGARPSAPQAEESGGRRPRRALVCAGPSVAAMLERQLRTAGYATVVASAADAPKAVADFDPNVVLVGLHNGTDGERIALARRLRAAPATYGLPLVFLYHKDERAHRSAALSIGADDYFSLATPPAELCARLDALFWRAEAGRRAAPVVGERRAEIDNFMFLLDAVRDDMENGAEGGALAVVEGLSADAAGDGAGGGTVAAAQGFFKLNLRRADSVAFYGPTLLLVYLPRVTLEEARAQLARLREEFARRHPGQDLAVGLAAFPGIGEVETLVEQAELAASAAADPDAPARVLTFEQQQKTAAPDAPGGSATASPASPAPRASGESAARARDASDIKADAAPDTRPAAPSERAASGEREAPPEAPAAPEHAYGRRKSDAAPAPGATAPRRAPNLEEVDAWARRSAEVGARELERRARGVVMPRRLLLAVSDPARMAQLNLLARSAGYDVRAAFDAQQALSLLRIERPDMLVIDFDLQGMNGLEALRRLRQQSGGRLPAPVVLLCDAGREDAHREALEAGARAAVALPCDPSEFLDAVRRAGGVD